MALGETSTLLGAKRKIKFQWALDVKGDERQLSTTVHH